MKHLFTFLTLFVFLFSLTSCERIDSLKKLLKKSYTQQQRQEKRQNVILGKKITKEIKEHQNSEKYTKEYLNLEQEVVEKIINNSIKNGKIGKITSYYFYYFNGGHMSNTKYIFLAINEFDKRHTNFHVKEWHIIDNDKIEVRFEDDTAP